MGSPDIRVYTFGIGSLLLLGAVVGLGGCPTRRWAIRGALSCAFAGSLFAAYGAIGFWQRPMAGAVLLFRLRPVIPDLPPIQSEVFVDHLSAALLLLSGLLAAAVALYSFAWLQDKPSDPVPEPHRIAGVYNLLVLFTLLLLVENNVYFFVFWLECITLAFGYLTLYHHNKLEARPDAPPDELDDAKRAFQIYLIFSHAGAVCIAVALMLLALDARDFSFATFRSRQLVISPAVAHAVFALGVIGFGIKAAMVPVHSWMGKTHPYLPTNIHALVSAIIIKVTGIYGMFRVMFEFLPPQWWWGLLLLLLASLTALVGVFYAITGRDLKTTLANHSVENIGIILAGLGLGLLYRGVLSTLAGLAVVASLYHLINHALFKGLLFLATGAIEQRTGTVELEHLGGLLRRYPATAMTFLVGSAAIAGFPPFNGFISEWLLLQAIFAGLNATPATPNWVWLAAPLLVSLVMLGTAFGLTALAFVKIAGEALLGQPRRAPPHPTEGHVPRRMSGVLIVLAALCLLLGLVPGLILPGLTQIATDLTGSPVTLMYTPTRVTVDLPAGAGSAVGYQAQIVPLSLLPVAALPLLLALLAGAYRGRTVSGGLWTGGTPYQPSTMQMTGSAFSFLTWAWAGRRMLAPSQARSLPDELSAAPRRPDTSPATQPSAANAESAAGEHLGWRLPLSSSWYVIEYFLRALNSVIENLIRASQAFGKRFQNGDIRWYLGFLFVTFMVVLIISLML